MQPRKEFVKWDLKLWPGVTFAVLILILKAEAGNNVTEDHRCYWCGPLAEQVHRSARAHPCHHPLKTNVTCESGLRYCATVATAHPYVESRFCVKTYQDECYPLYCNTTNTWKMICPCRGEFCNGANTEREIEAFGKLIKLAAKSSRSRTNKRSVDNNNATLSRTAADAVAASSIEENYDEVPGNALDNTDQVEFNENLGIATFAIVPDMDDKIHALDVLKPYSDFVSVNDDGSLGSTTDSNILIDSQAIEQNIKTGDVLSEITTTDAPESESSRNENKSALLSGQNNDTAAVDNLEIQHQHLFIRNKIEIEETDFTKENPHWDTRTGAFTDKEPDDKEIKKTNENINDEHNTESEDSQKLKHIGEQEPADKVNMIEMTNKDIDLVQTQAKDDEYYTQNQHRQFFIESENKMPADTGAALKTTNRSLPAVQALLQNMSPSAEDEMMLEPTETSMPLFSDVATTTQAHETTATSQRDNYADKLTYSAKLFILVISIGMLL